MSNFEYIIASLPFLTQDFRYQEGRGWTNVIEEIKDNLSEKDAEALDFLLRGFGPDNLVPDFYASALSHPVKFIREYFRYDLNLRNAKVSYINDALGRAAGQDILDGRVKTLMKAWTLTATASPAENSRKRSGSRPPLPFQAFLTGSRPLTT